jgi:hypothetical protein
MIPVHKSQVFYVEEDSPDDDAVNALIRTGAINLVSVNSYKTTASPGLTDKQTTQIQSLVSGGWILYANILETNTDVQNAAIVQAQIDLAEGIGYTKGGGTVTLPSGDFAMSALEIGNGYAEMGNSYRGGIRLVGAGKLATRLRFTGTTGVRFKPRNSYTTQVSPPSYPLDSDEIADMALIGPGVGVSGGRAIDAVATDASYYALVNCAKFTELTFDAWETCVALDVAGDGYFTGCRFIEFLYGVRFGYNCDKWKFDTCTFGKNTISAAAPDNRVATAIDYSLTSPYFGAASSNNQHVFVGCMFLRLLRAFDFADYSMLNVKINSYFESVHQYARFGPNTTATQGAKAIEFDNCHFSNVYYSGETLAKFQMQGANCNANLTLRTCASDSVNGPNGGWIICGYSGMVVIDNCQLPYAGSSAAQWHIQRASKNIVIDNGARYVFRGDRPGVQYQQFNANANTSIPATAVYAYQADANTIFSEFGTKSSAAELVVGPWQMRALTINSVWTAHSKGYHMTPPSANAPPAAAAAYNGFFYIQTTGGVDTLSCCMQTSTGVYAWVVIKP